MTADEDVTEAAATSESTGAADAGAAAVTVRLIEAVCINDPLTEARVIG